MRCGLRHGNINEMGEKASVKPRKSPPAPPLSIKTRQPFLQTLKIAIPRECLAKKQIYRGTLMQLCEKCNFGFVMTPFSLWEKGRG